MTEPGECAVAGCSDAAVRHMTIGGYKSQGIEEVEVCLPHARELTLQQAVPVLRRLLALQRQIDDEPDEALKITLAKQAFATSEALLPMFGDFPDPEMKAAAAQVEAALANVRGLMG